MRAPKQLAVFALSALLWLSCSGPETSASKLNRPHLSKGHNQLIRALQGSRVIQPHLTGLEKLRPCPNIVKGRCRAFPKPGSLEFERVAAAGRQIAAESSELDTHGKAVWLLLWSENSVDESIRILERHYRLDPSSRALATDLSAAYLMQGLALDRPELFADVIEILDAPGSIQLPEPAKENLALALERLSLQAAGDNHDLSLQRGRNGPVLLSQGIEDRLSKWAEAVLEKDIESQEAIRDQIAFDGRQLWDSAQDHTLLEIVDLLEQPRMRVAMGVRTYARGLTLLRQLRLKEAESQLEVAVRNWSQAPVLRRWGRYQLGILAYQQTKYHLALESFSQLSQELLALDEPVLTGRVEYMTALIYAIQGNHDAFRSHTRAALAAFEKAGDSTGVGRSLQDLAIVDRTLGDVESAWRHAVGAKSVTNPSNAPNAAFNATLTLGELARETGRLRTAKRLNRQLELLADRIEAPHAEVSAMREAAKFEVATGNWHRAAEIVEQALELVGKLPDTSVKQGMFSDLLLVRARALAKADRAQAVRDLERTILYYKSSEYRLFLPNLAGVLGTLLRQEGDSLESRRAFTSALAEVEAQAATVESPAERSRLLYSARELFNSLISDHANQGDWPAAFFRAEQARSRFSRGRPSHSNTREFDYLAPRTSIGKGATVVSYYVSDQEIFAWTIRDERFTGQRLKLTREDLESRLEDLAVTIRSPDHDPEARLILEELFKDLLQPLSLDWKELTSLIVVPDGPLRNLPFSALINPATQSFLVERTTVILMPNTPAGSSLTNAPLNQPAAGSGMALLVEGPSGAGLDLDLPTLLGVEREMDRVASRYDNVTLLRGPGATRSALAEHIESAEVFHFAGHARSSALDDESNGLFLAAPDIGNVELFSSEKMSALHAPHLRLVVLAACETASPGHLDRPGPMSLADSFMSLGADEVIGALWSVDDAYTSAFSASIHEKMGDHESGALALQEAKLKAIGEGVVPLSVWAAFESYERPRNRQVEVQD